MAKLSTSTGANLHPRENYLGTGSLGALNAEIVIDCDGCSTVALDLRGTFSMTIEVAGTIDGVNWTLIPVKPINQASKLYVAAVTGTAAGSWVGSCPGFEKVRARVTAFTSGSATTVLVASNSVLDQSLDGNVTNSIGTILGTAGAAATLTLASPGAGLRHYITSLKIERYATVALTASATPVAVTTTNLPGTLAFTFPADALALGGMDRWREEYTRPIASSAQATATTIVCPAVTSVIWRVTAGYYVAP